MQHPTPCKPTLRVGADCKVRQSKSISAAASTVFPYPSSRIEIGKLLTLAQDSRLYIGAFSDDV